MRHETTIARCLGAPETRVIRRAAIAEPHALARAMLSAPADSFDEQNTHTEDRLRWALESCEARARDRIGKEMAIDVKDVTLALLKNREHMENFVAAQEKRLAQYTKAGNAVRLFYRCRNSLADSGPLFALPSPPRTARVEYGKIMIQNTIQNEDSSAT
jgi:hypothetical protein